MRSALLDRSTLCATALLFSTGGVAIKACSLGPAEIACARSGLAALALLVGVRAARRPPGRSGLLVGLAYAATLALFVVSNKLTTAAHAIFLQSSAPFWVLLLAPRLLGERFVRRDLAVLAALALGLALLVSGGVDASASAPRPRLGNALAALAGLSWGLTLLGLRARARGADAPARGGAMPAVVAGNVLVFLGALPFAVLAPARAAPPQAADLLALAWLGLFQVGLAYVLMARSLPRLGALEAALLLTLEPAASPLWAWLVFREDPGLAAWSGGALIVCASLARSWRELRLAPAARGG